MIDRGVEYIRRFQTAITVAVLALLAYGPSLRAARGLMPADSKLYVYLDPGRFISDTTTSFDPRQFGGWVPHQHIAYLWPTGPWYWVFETLGVPDWIAHRLWIGTLLFTAGLGVRWMARVLGFNPLAAFAAAIVYQLSPYILPYISRTSVLLLPFAGLGWIVGLTIRASIRGRWRYPAAIALVVLTVGAVNATALAMVIPAPVIWLVHAAWGRTITWRRAAATAAKTALLCTGVSLWWMMMLVIQGRHGADVLAYSESLESVSFTSTSTEVTRGLGYWLFYVRDAYSATTAASFEHLVDAGVVLVNFLVVAIGLGGIVFCRWEHRRFAALLFGAGVILAVGVHPIDDPSPLMSLLVGDGEGGLALALRSSTRAVPVMLLGVALGAAAVVSGVRVPRRLRDRGRTPTDGAPIGSGFAAVGVRIVAATLIAVMAIAGLPALRGGRLVDFFLLRDQDPPASWVAAADDLDARPDGYRVLQVPGEEFGAFQWGYTVDQPLPGLTDRPLLTRDLLPLGSPAAMDLLFGLDDRFQNDTVEPEAVAAVSRLLGVDTVWVSGDVEYGRFQLARPEVVTAELTSPAAVEAGLVDATAFGDPVVMPSFIPMVDNRSLSDPLVGEPIAPVTLVDVLDPVPVERAKDDVVVLSGSGDGIIDAAGAGIIDGYQAVLYSASLDADTPLGSSYRFVLTDSNRDRAHHWRSSQDVTGFTESAATGSDVLTFESGDQRLPVFEADREALDSDEENSDEQTVSIQVGPVTARASGYGERFAYLPEHRPVMAIDDDTSTAWLVAERADALGEFIELEVSEPIDHLDLLQPVAGPDERTITEVAVTIDDQAPFAVSLDDASREVPGQRVAIEPTTGASTVRITITATTTPQPPIGEAIGGVGFVEIDTGLGPTTEFIRTPVDGLDAMGAAGGVDIVLTRLWVEPTDRWRDDPEPTLAREFEIADDLDIATTVTLRLDRRLPDGELAELLGESAVATEHLTGAPSTRGAAAFDDDDSTVWTTPFDRLVGQAVVYSGDGTATEMTIAQPGGDHSPITTLRVTDPDGSFDIEIPSGADAVVDLPRPIDLSDLRLEIAAVDAQSIQNRRFNEATVLPAGISEIRFDDESPAIAPVERITTECRDDLLRLDGEAVPIRYDVSSADALAGAAFDAALCEPVEELSAGTHRLVSTESVVDVDRVVFSTPSTPAASESAVDPTRSIVVESSRLYRSVEVPACPDGCWVIHGEGYNPAWTASVDGESLGEPTLIDGNANGWWLPPTDAPTRVEIDWPVQRNLNIAFALSVLAVLACVALILWDRRRADDRALHRANHHTGTVDDSDMNSDVATGPSIPAGRRAQIVSAVATIAAAALFIGPVWALPVVAVWAVAIAMRIPRLVGWAGLAIVMFSGLTVANVVRTEEPFPDAGWPVRFEWLHGWTLLGVVLVTGSALVATRRSDEAEPT